MKAVVDEGNYVSSKSRLITRVMLLKTKSIILLLFSSCLRERQHPPQKEHILILEAVFQT